MFRFIVYFCLLLFYVGTALVHSAGSADVVCKQPTEEDKKTTTFCFFSLNNPKEFEKLEKQYANNPQVEIKEFYGSAEKGESVEKQFKEMLKSDECDSVVISGHHTGYFTGSQSIGNKNRSGTLNLDFMEEMSCKEGCADWFSNVKSLFLMGCQTVKTDKNLDSNIKKSKTADSETIRVIKQESVPVSFGIQHTRVNQAYSSTLDQNDRLSHRYLRMFPNSSVYGWGEIAPGVKAGSEDSLPQFIELAAGLSSNGNGGSNNITDTDNILNFISFMNNQDHTCKEYVAAQWAQHWKYKSTKPTACYLAEAEQKSFKGHQRLGCELTKALKKDNKSQINKAIDSILDSGPDGIKNNFNRLLSMIINKKNQEKSWYQEVVNKLKNNNALKDTLKTAIESKGVGFTRKSDYLYFYKEMGWGDQNENSKISRIFLNQLAVAFGKIGEENVDDSVKTAHRYAVFDSIAQNNLGEWLSKSNKRAFNRLKDSKFMKSKNQWDQMAGHFLSYLGDNPSEADVRAADSFAKGMLEKQPEYYSLYKEMVCGYRKQISSPPSGFTCRD